MNKISTFNIDDYRQCEYNKHKFHLKRYENVDYKLDYLIICIYVYLSKINLQKSKTLQVSIL